ncbi:MAG: PH domain-containing protein [Candidatus Dojkabacteria bacterium]
MKKLNPKVIWLFFIQSSLGILISTFFIGIFFVLPILIGFMEDSGTTTTFTGVFIVGLGIYIVFALFIIALCYLFARLSYNNYMYELKEDGFYKESGVITKKYVTIPYERIQNVDINRGLMARILGLSDLQIQTAGMSTGGYGKYGAYGVAAEGRLPGVSKEDANTIRDELIKRAKGARNTGGM